MTMSQADDDGISFGRGHNIRVKKRETNKKEEEASGMRDEKANADAY